MAIHTGKCPKCDEVMSNVTLQAVTAQEPFGISINAVSYQCPHCHTVLSVGMDRIALERAIVTGVAKRLGR